MTDEIERIRRCQGMLFGVAFGDALGATAEFTEPGATDHRDMIGGGAFGWAPGAWTDDTQQTVIVAECLVKGTVAEDAQRLTDDVRDALRDWLAGDPVDVGTTTRRGIEGRPLVDSEANGSLMRTAPIAAVRHRATRIAMATKVSAVTHLSQACIRACAQYTDWCGELLNGAPIPADLKENDGWHEALAGRGLSACPFEQDGHVLRSLWIAAWAAARVHAGLSAEDVLLEIVHAGGDADTHAAIAGGLLGAMGAVWPDRWYTQVAGGPRLTVLANQLAEIGRPV